MYEFVGRQSALPLEGSYLIAMKIIYLLILWLVQEIKKPRRAASREDFSVLCMNLKFKRAGGRFFPWGKQKSTAQAKTHQLRIGASTFLQAAIQDGLWHSGSDTQIPHSL